MIATVGDQAIRFSQLTQELDQGAAAGVSVPGYGTPERKRILKRLLDETIRTELLYLDALRKGVDQDPGYQRQLKRFKEGALAGCSAIAWPTRGNRWSRTCRGSSGGKVSRSQIDEDALDPARDAARATTRSW